MQKFIKMRLFQLLTDTSQNENYSSLLEESCDEFAMKVLTRLQLETNHSELYFSFGFIHLKLAGICERLTGEKGKKCPENRSQSHVFGRVSQIGIGMANNRTKG